MSTTEAPDPVIGDEDSIESPMLIDPEEGSSDNRIHPNSLRGSLSRSMEFLGKHFNVLDKLLTRGTQQQSNQQPGANHDGVFSNLTAKPDANDNNNIENEALPSYDAAANDMVPLYHGAGSDNLGSFDDEICIEGLPVGTIANFFWNLVVCACFQYLGFLITYILHTSHAARQGSRLGLGVTFIGYAYSMIPNNVNDKVGKNKPVPRIHISDPYNYNELDPFSGPTTDDHFKSTLPHAPEEKDEELPLIAVLIGILGIFVILKSIYDYVQIKKMERKYLRQEVV